MITAPQGGGSYRLRIDLLSGHRVVTEFDLPADSGLDQDDIATETAKAFSRASSPHAFANCGLIVDTTDMMQPLGGHLVVPVGQILAITVAL